MAEKEFTLKVIKSEPTPRRRRVAPGANGDAMNRVSTGSQVSGSGNAGSAQGDGHVHANKGALDKIGVTDDGYVTITDMPGAETVTEKAKAGYADTAGTADEAKTLTEDSEVWEMFVSRLKDDVVKGNISFEKAIAVAGLATLAGGLKIGSYGIDKSGKATLAEVAATLMKATSAEAGRLKVTEAAEIVLSLLKSADFVSGATGKGVAIQKNGSSWRMEIDELLVRKIATFLKLEIRELSYVGGNIVLSKAGNEITAVEKVGGGWKCSFTSNEGDEVQNFWKAGDQARCQTFGDAMNRVSTTVSTKYYWRLVTEVGEDYVVLSETDYDTGVTNSEPAAGDKIVQMGFRLSGDEEDKDRTSLIILSTSGENTPSIEAYTGITAYELGAEKRLFILSPGEVSFRSDMFRWMSGGVKFPQEVYRGDWESGTVYNYYEKVTHNGSTWICIATEGTSSEPVKGSAAWKEYAEKGADGTAGKGIKSITEYYLATSAGSGVTTGTSGWTTAVQTITAAKRFLWNYEKVAYTDGTSSKSSPVIIGVYGEKGEAGTSVTVSSTTTTYAVGTSGTTPPDGGWSSNVPAVPAGQYLWSKTIVTYSDGKSTTTYSVSYQGTNGSPGKPGTSVTITGQATKYAVTPTAGQPADSAFTSDKIPALLPGDYLWSRTTVTYSSGVQTKSYAVSRIGADGTDGLPGSDGKNSYTHFAYASSADGATGFSTTYFEGALYLGTCSDFNEADPEDYKAYTWARMKGKDGASYSPNLIVGTKEMYGWSWGHDNPGRVSITREEDENGFYRIKSECIQAGRVNGYTWIQDDFPDEPHNIFKPGEKYTLSLEYKATNTVYFGVDIREATTNTKINILPGTYFPASENWTRISLEGICPTGADDEKWKRSLLFAALTTSTAAVGDVAYIRKICLVEGTNTQWVPAASEMVGVDGVSVTAVKNMYKAGTSSTKAPEGTYVADVMQAGFSETNKYLWGYEINTLSDGKTIETTKHLVSVWGQTGKPGTDGTKIIPAELTTAFNATYVQWLTLYNQTVGKVWNVDNASDYRVGDTAVITGNVTDRGNIKASLYASVITVNTKTGVIGTRSYSLVVGNQGEQGVPGSSGIDAKRNLLMNSGVEKTGTAYLVRSDLFITPLEGYVLPGTHTGSLIEGEKYTAVVCFTPNAAGKSLMLYHLGVAQCATWSVESTAERQIFKETFTFSYRAGYDPRPTTDGGDGYAYFFMRLYYGSSSNHPGGTLHWIKLVRGEVATDEWTPAPEDSDVFDVQVSPAALSFKTDEDDGSVIYSGNTVTITATRGGQAAKVSYVSSSAQLTGLTGLQNSGSGTETMKVTLTGISYTTQELKVPNGTGYDTKQMQIPVTSGQAAFKVKLTYGGYTEERTITVPFTVDVKASLVSLGTTANSIVGQVWDTNGVVSRLSKVEQTAGSITSTVESMPLGGPNLLPHSMWRAVVRTETGNTWVKLKKGVKYTLSARACAEEGKDLFVSAYAVQSSGQWGRSNAMRFTEADFADKSLTFVLEDKNGFTYNDEVRVQVYAVNVVKGTASATEGKGAVVWVQLEEGPAATTWQAQAGDYEERPSLLKADEWTHDKGVEDKEVKLADGTTGTAKYYKAPSTMYRNVVMSADAKNPLFAEPDTQYTVSVWAKGSGELRMYLRATQTLGCVSGEGVLTTDKDGTAVFELTDEWKRYEATVTTGATVTENAVYAARVMNGGEMWCYGWKVEKGGMATGGGGASLRYESEIQQLDKEINLSVKKDDLEVVGIHLDGEESTIRLVAGKTVIEGGEFDAGDAVFKNLTVEGNLRTSVVQQAYADDNIFVGKDRGGALGWMFVHSAEKPGAAVHVFLPTDADFIGSRVTLYACAATDNEGSYTSTTVNKMNVYGGRVFCKHGYLEKYGSKYYLSTVGMSNTSGSGIRNVVQEVLKAVFLSGMIYSSHVANAMLNLYNGGMELLGVPAYSANAVLCPYRVKMNDADGDSGRDSLYSRGPSGYAVVDDSAFDPLYERLRGMSSQELAALGEPWDNIGTYGFVYHNAAGTQKEFSGPLFRVPLCQWFVTGSVFAGAGSARYNTVASAGGSETPEWE